MKARQTRVLQALRRGVGWYTTNLQAISATPSAAALGGHVETLKEVVERVSLQATVQETQGRQATLAARDELERRHALRTLHMSPIVRLARALMGTVEGTGIFRMPEADARSEALVQAANAIHDEAVAYKDTLVQHGLPSDFLEQLAAAAAALKACVDARGVAISLRHKATEDVGSDLKQGRRILTIMDATLTHALKDQPTLLASWRQAKRVTNKGVVAPVASDPVTVSGGGSTPAATPGTVTT